MRTFLVFVFLIVATAINGQTFQIKGDILDEKAEPLPSATVFLLSPADSTMIYFAVAGTNGMFGISNIKKGSYLLQISLITYKTIYRNISFPSSYGDDLGTIIMIPQPAGLNEVKVTGERIPVKIRKDTIEYDARAFRVKSDGAAEDLIKKLPGMEVDRAGNIKAMGENVKNVLVDGKEFFGNDPKVATRNLPADAINKVQLFDKKSDESRFTGIDDGERNPTLNLVLNDNKKTGIFGDVTAGGGTGNHALTSARVFRFTKKIQFAGLGMFNNINEFGFSIGDFINFSGGIEALSSGSGLALHSDDTSFPVNFGQPVYGSGSNGAAGLNFSVSKSENNRFFASYLGSGSSRKLSENSTSQYFQPDGSYFINEQKNQIKRDSSHRLNFGWRRLINEKQNIILNGKVSYNSASNPLSSVSGSFLNDIRVNSLDRNTNEIKSGLSGDVDASYLFRINEGKTILKLTATGGYSGSKSNTRLLDRTEYLNPYMLNTDNQFFNLHSSDENWSGTVSFTQKITRQSFIDLSLMSRYSSENIDRKQGNISDLMVPIDSLSPVFQKTDKYLQPALTWKYATTKSLISVALSGYIGSFGSLLGNAESKIASYFYLSPRASWELNYKSGRRLMVDYLTGVNTPGAEEMIPVVNNINPLSLFYGNRDLRPEYFHNMRMSYWLFDQFSFTTLLATLNSKYTVNKISFSGSVDENLRQILSPVNVRDDWNNSVDIDFSTPVRPLGIKMDISLSEAYNRGRDIINGTENINTNFNHKISLTLENRKKTHWDVETGSALTITDSRYSIQKSLNNIYQDISWFSEIRYTPGARFSFTASADITNYSAKTFNRSQIIPLIGSEINYYFLKNQRGVLTLKSVDLLNRNTGIERTSELSYLVERRSDMLGRYIILSFKYRLNKLGDNKNGIDVQVKRR
jgi:hypothetical protein